MDGDKQAEFQGAFLVIARGAGAGRRIPLTRPILSVGRAPSNDVVLADAEVSQFHLRLKLRQNSFVVEDLGSHNGTYLNGDRVRNALGKSGDRLLVGSTELLLVAERDVVSFDTNIGEVVASHDALALPSLVAPLPGQTQVEHRPDIALNTVSLPVSPSQRLVDLSLNVLASQEFEESARTLIKGIGLLLPAVKRAAVFIRNGDGKRLSPLVSQHFTLIAAPFHMNGKAAIDALEGRPSSYTTQDLLATHVALWPIGSEMPATGLVQVEWESPQAPSAAELALAQNLVGLCSSHLGALQRRHTQDDAVFAYVQSILASIAAKDTYTGGHSERVSRYCMAIAETLKLDRNTKRVLLISALCHDVGKIGVADAVLKKPGLLSTEEYLDMKTHPDIGARIIGKLPDARRFLPGIKHHHERWDGSGYPDGLAGEEIPFFARIIAIADAFDAMVSGRSYAGFSDQAQAVRELAGKVDLFDPTLLQAFVQAYESGLLTIRTNTQRAAEHGESGSEVLNALI